MLMLERYLLDIHRNRLKPTVENVYIFYLSETYQLLLWCWPVYAYFNFLFWGHHKKKKNKEQMIFRKLTLWAGKQKDPELTKDNLK